MTNQFLQCLKHSKLLLMYAENSDWEAFEKLHPIWSKEVDNYLTDNIDYPLSSVMRVSIQSLIDDVDIIQDLIKVKMSQIKEDFSVSIQMNKAVQTYLK